MSEATSQRRPPIDDRPYHQSHSPITLPPMLPTPAHQPSSTSQESTTPALPKLAHALRASSSRARSADITADTVSKESTPSLDSRLTGYTASDSSRHCVADSSMVSRASTDSGSSVPSGPSGSATSAPSAPTAYRGSRTVNVNVAPFYADDPGVEGLPRGPVTLARPTECLAGIMGRAILASRARGLSLEHLYRWIEAAYPFFTTGRGGGWRNSVRHTLSIHKMFDKVERTEAHPMGKGGIWQVVEGEEVHWEDPYKFVKTFPPDHPHNRVCKHWNFEQDQKLLDRLRKQGKVPEKVVKTRRGKGGMKLLSSESTTATPASDHEHEHDDNSEPLPTPSPKRRRHTKPSPYDHPSKRLRIAESYAPPSPHSAPFPHSNLRSEPYSSSHSYSESYTRFPLHAQHAPHAQPYSHERSHSQTSESSPLLPPYTHSYPLPYTHTQPHAFSHLPHDTRPISPAHAAYAPHPYPHSPHSLASRPRTSFERLSAASTSSPNSPGGAGVDVASPHGSTRLVTRAPSTGGGGGGGEQGQSRSSSPVVRRSAGGRYAPALGASSGRALGSALGLVGTQETRSTHASPVLPSAGAERAEGVVQEVQKVQKVQKVQEGVAMAVNPPAESQRAGSTEPAEEEQPLAEDERRAREDWEWEQRNARARDEERARAREREKAQAAALAEATKREREREKGKEEEVESRRQAERHAVEEEWKAQEREQARERDWSRRASEASALSPVSTFRPMPLGAEHHHQRQRSREHDSEHDIYTYEARREERTRFLLDLERRSQHERERLGEEEHEEQYQRWLADEKARLSQHERERLREEEHGEQYQRWLAVEKARLEAEHAREQHVMMARQYKTVLKAISAHKREQAAQEASEASERFRVALEKLEAQRRRDEDEDRRVRSWRADEDARVVAEQACERHDTAAREYAMAQDEDRARRLGRERELALERSRARAKVAGGVWCAEEIAAVERERVRVAVGSLIGVGGSRWEDDEAGRARAVEQALGRERMVVERAREVEYQESLKLKAEGQIPPAEGYHWGAAREVALEGQPREWMQRSPEPRGFHERESGEQGRERPGKGAFRFWRA